MKTKLLHSAALLGIATANLGVVVAAFTAGPASAQNECLLDTDGDNEPSAGDSTGGAESRDPDGSLENFACGPLADNGIIQADHATAIGYGATTQNGQTETSSSSSYGGSYSTAVGNRTRTDGPDATAVGASAYAMAGGVSMGRSASAMRSATAIGAYSEADRYGTAVGRGANSGLGSVAIGYAAQAENPSGETGNSVAIGYGTIASGTNSTSLGGRANALGVASVAVGYSADASGENAASMGYDAVASGRWSTALGYNAVADAFQSFAAGTGSGANGIGSTAIGAYSGARARFASAYGYASYAAAENATAFGTLSSARGLNSSAFGYQARTDHNGSTAIGTGATTTANNQIMLGSAGTQVVIADIDASTAAQTGPVDVVTIDSNGVLGRQQTASAAAVATVRRTMTDLAVVSDAQFAALDNRVGALESGFLDLGFRLEELDSDYKAGVAAAMAQAEAPFPPEPGQTGYAMRGSTFRGEFGFSLGISHRLNTEAPIVFTASVNHAGDDATGGTVGIAGIF
ncbi:MAG: hypothetical protein CL808_03865 [Citromicrobium sp.]|nr:hypothetical protein [Citromicrobium sp.]